MREARALKMELGVAPSHPPIDYAVFYNDAVNSELDIKVYFAY
jgi:hypothetical protein